MNRLKYILRHRYIYKIIAIFLLIIVICLTQKYQLKSIYKITDTEFIGTIYKIKKENNKTTIYLKAKEKLIINYYGKIDNLSLGDEIKAIGNLKLPSNNTIFNGFNYRKYLYYNKIYYIVNATNVEKISNNTNVIYYLRDKISKRIDNIPKSNQYIKIFILGSSDLLSDETLENYRQNGISHIFSISGMHISLFATILLYFLKRVSYNIYYNSGMVILFLILYTILIGPSPSVIRSIIMYILFTLNKLFHIKTSNINIMCFTLIIILLFKPLYIYTISFQYSYIISFSLIVYGNKLKYIKKKYLKSLYTSLICFLVSLPICISYFYQVNILSILLNIIIIPFVSIIIFPLSLISFIIPKFSYILNIFTSILEICSNTIAKYNIGIISFPKPNIITIILDYIFIYLFLYNNKYFYIIIILILQKYSIYLNTNTKVLYFDVNQGDSIFITFPHNKLNILIDNGGSNNSQYHIFTSKVLPYFKSVGVSKIHYLVLTHGDYDHMGEAINLVNNFKVEKVIFNCGEYNDLEKDLIKVLDKKKIKYYSCIKELNIDNNKLYFLQTKEYDNENDNSNVIYTELNGYKFMFMGDASTTTEKEIMNKYNLPDIDVLKVGHHGSKTSSSIEFIDELKPKYSIISVGKKNRYGHPNKEVLDVLSNSKIYRTDEDGSIMFKIKNNKLKIETCEP